jgi:lipoate-protein ligase A
MIYIQSLSVDPEFNLALEEYVFETVGRKKRCVHALAER